MVTCVMREEWRDVVGYEGLYQVSNSGKVRSLNYNRTGKVKELKLIFDKNGYLMVNIMKNGERKYISVHRLVAQSFLPNPDNLPVINHRDEVKTNNHISNLEWCTVKYNLEYSNVGEKAYQVTRKPVLQFTKSGEFITEYESMCDAERQCGVNHSHISGCCSGKRKSAGGFIWKFKDIQK